MQIPVTVSNLMTPCLCKLVLLCHVIVLWQESLGSQHKVIQSVCTWTGSRTSYPSFILVLCLPSCPFYPSPFSCGCIPVFSNINFLAHWLKQEQSLVNTWDMTLQFWIHFYKKSSKPKSALFALSKENIIRHTILKLQLAGSIIHFNSKLSNQEDFLLRTTNICPSAE